MIELPLARLAELTPGRWVSTFPEQARAQGVFIDSRQVSLGGIFVALPGEKVDGHDFCQSVAGKAAAVIVSRPVETTLPQFLVADGERALADLARYWRRNFSKPLIAVTGSNGKTTTKNMIAAILSAAYPEDASPASTLSADSGIAGLSDDAVLALPTAKAAATFHFSSRIALTQGNLNNHLGVPLTLFTLNPQSQAAAVIEMGANHAGEIAYLTAITEPDIGLITNAGPAHLEGFGSLAGVAKSKGELFDFPLQTAIVNVDDGFSALWLERSSSVAKRLWRCSFVDAKAECFGQWQGEKLRLTTPLGSAEVTLKLLGKHNAFNALLAAAAALAAGAPLTALHGLENLAPEPGRLQPLPLAAGRLLIHDAYNANPASVKAALAVLAEFVGRPKIFIFGDMGEVGDSVAAVHREVGRQAQAVGVQELFTLGKHSGLALETFTGKGFHFIAFEDFLQVLPELPEQAVVLVKASRFMRLERVVAAFQSVYSLEKKEQL